MISVDAATGGALMGKSIEAVKALLEEMTSNNYHWSSERAAPKRSSGRYDVDVVTLLTNRMDALAHWLDRVGTLSPAGVYAVCETCGVQGHTFVKCYNGSFIIEHANALHSFNPPLNHNSHFTTYNQGWKSHLNPLYKNYPNSHPQSSTQLFGFQYRALYTPPLPPPQP